jgi:hypothetical protein
MIAVNIDDPVRDHNADQLNIYLCGISGYDLFYQHPGKHAAIIAWFLADHPDGNIAQLIKWYKKHREDEAFQRRLLDAA